MVRIPKQFGWILAAWAAVVAQIAPTAVCRSCDTPCCTAAVESDVEPAGDCPLCAAVAKPSDHCTGDSANTPCRCQLDARQDQPASLARGVSPTVDQAGCANGLAVACLEPPQVLGVSREYLAASIAVPIRPPRILYGVWRN